MTTTYSVEAVLFMYCLGFLSGLISGAMLAYGLSKSRKKGIK